MLPRSVSAMEISIHAPCTGSDGRAVRIGADGRDFNPRSLHGERLSQPDIFVNTFPISIHAPCTGSDVLRKPEVAGTHHFNPRSLHGERLAAPCQSMQRLPFQSTLPARGATLNAVDAARERNISIHAPCTGSDGIRPAEPNVNIEISIHAPCTGSDTR